MTKHECLSMGLLIDPEDVKILDEQPFYYDSVNRRLCTIILPNTLHATTRTLTSFIFPVSQGKYADHINRNRMDERKVNLREATASQNAQNKGLYSTNKSGYKGVSLHSNGKWKAQIKYNGKKLHIGYFVNPHDAAIAYDEMAVQLHKEFACTNKSLGLI